jgi:hypothetical protein
MYARLRSMSVWLVVSIFFIMIYAEISYAEDEVPFENIPSVIRLSDAEAISQLTNASIPYEMIDGYNSSVGIGIIYDQTPKNSKDYAKSNVIKIYRSIPKIEIYTPESMKYVNNSVVVRGHIDRNLGENDYLWIGAKPYKDIKNWWPQDNDRIKPVKGIFEGNAFLGGENNDKYEIGIFIVNGSLNKKIEDWLDFNKKYNIWPAITEEKEFIPTINKEILETYKYANVTVIINQSIS